MMRIRFTAASALLTGASLLLAQTPSSDAWKKKNDRGNRYEGLVDIQTANPRLDLLSFTGYFRAFEGKQEWRVEFYSPERAPGIVAAREVEDQYQYWMESYPIPATPHDWTKFLGLENR
jgi:hypothetical protein